MSGQGWGDADQHGSGRHSKQGGGGQGGRLESLVAPLTQRILDHYNTERPAGMQQRTGKRSPRAGSGSGAGLFVRVAWSLTGGLERLLWVHGQVLALQDCVYRSMGHARRGCMQAACLRHRMPYGLIRPEAGSCPPQNCLPLPPAHQPTNTRLDLVLT